VSDNTEELMLDLLCKQAVYGLSEDETRQLRELGGDIDGGDAASLEATAAMIAMAGVDVNEQMPAHILAKISDSADQYFDALPSNKGRYADRSNELVTAAAPRSSLMNWLGWAVAAAACVALAFNVYLTRIQPNRVEQADTPKATPTVQEKLTPPQMREMLMKTAPDVEVASWAPVPKMEGFQQVAGDVVWSDQKQAGYMRLTGFPANDASRETYQLWIFEENQGDKTPIDGGTFDVSSSGEVIVPITARLKAKNPKMFAVTVEKPGGVVVSDRKKIAAIAKIET
jgi:anti-sigma-K factor RskA